MRGEWQLTRTTGEDWQDDSVVIAEPVEASEIDGAKVAGEDTGIRLIPCTADRAVVTRPAEHFTLPSRERDTADHPRVTAVLTKVASELPIALVEPEPMVLFQRFGDSAQEFQFSVWATQENFRKLRQTIPEAVRAALARERIDIPFPQRMVHVTSSGQAAITPR